MLKGMDMNRFIRTSGYGDDIHSNYASLTNGNLGTGALTHQTYLSSAAQQSYAPYLHQVPGYYDRARYQEQRMCQNGDKAEEPISKCDRCGNRYKHQAALERHRAICATLVLLDSSEDEDVNVDDSTGQPNLPPSRRPEYEDTVVISDDEGSLNKKGRQNGVSSDVGSNKLNTTSGIPLEGLAAGIYETATKNVPRTFNPQLISSQQVSQYSHRAATSLNSGSVGDANRSSHATTPTNATSTPLNSNGINGTYSSAAVRAANLQRPSVIATVNQPRFFQVVQSNSNNRSSLPTFVPTAISPNQSHISSNPPYSYLPTPADTPNRDYRNPHYNSYNNATSRTTPVPTSSQEQSYQNNYASANSNATIVYPAKAHLPESSPSLNGTRPGMSIQYHIDQTITNMLSKPLQPYSPSYMYSNSLSSKTDTITLEDATGKVNRISVSTVPPAVTHQTPAPSSNLNANCFYYPREALPRTSSFGVGQSQTQWVSPSQQVYLPASSNMTNHNQGYYSSGGSTLYTPYGQTNRFSAPALPSSMQQYPASTSLVINPNTFGVPPQNLVYGNNHQYLPTPSPQYRQLPLASTTQPQVLPHLSHPTMQYTGSNTSSFSTAPRPGDDPSSRVSSQAYLFLNSNSVVQAPVQPALPQIDLSSSFSVKHFNNSASASTSNMAHYQSQFQNSQSQMSLPQYDKNVPSVYSQYVFAPTHMCARDARCACRDCFQKTIAGKIQQEFQNPAPPHLKSGQHSVQSLKRRMVEILPKPSKFIKLENTMELSKPPVQKPPTNFKSSAVRSERSDSGFSDTSHSSKGSPPGSIVNQPQVSRALGSLHSLSQQVESIGTSFKPPKKVKTGSAVDSVRKALAPSEVANSISIPTKSPVKKLPKEKTKVVSTKRKRSPKPKSTAKPVKLTLKTKGGENTYSIKDVKKHNSENYSSMKSLKVKSAIKNGAGTANDVLVVPVIHVVPIPTSVEANRTVDENLSKDVVPAVAVSKVSETDDLKQHDSVVVNTHKYVIVYEIKVGGEVTYRSSDVRSVWDHVFLYAQGKTTKRDLPPLRYPATGVCLPHNMTDLESLGIDKVKVVHHAVQFLLQDLPKPEKKVAKKDVKLKKGKAKTKTTKLPAENEIVPQKANIHPGEFTCARTRIFKRTKEFDMFGWLASNERQWISIRRSLEAKRAEILRLQNRCRALRGKTSFNLAVKKSVIQGRGVFTKTEIPEGDIVIEYAGEIIRPILCDFREKLYESKGYGCYMFKIDDEQVIDATIRGNAARFINHSCEPNCKSKIVEINGRRRIFIYTLRKIFEEEELTYDYNFAKESRDKKIPCTCGAPRCRKFLN